MRVQLWGTRGSLASPGPETARYGGNTSCVEVRGTDGTVLVLDAGTGIRALGAMLSPAARRVDVLLTHLHMDHIQGLGFFAPRVVPLNRRVPQSAAFCRQTLNSVERDRRPAAPSLT